METLGNVSHYNAVIADLNGKRSYHQNAIAEIDTLILGIQKHLTNAANGRVSENPSAVHTLNRTVGLFSPLSLRRAARIVLWFSKGPMKTGEVAAKLLAGGFHSEARNFAGNVSATFSEDKKAGIVQVSDSGWILTEAGKQEVQKWLDEQPPGASEEFENAA